MRQNFFKLARILIFIFTIEWFYRLGAVNASVLDFGSSILAIFSLYVACLFQSKQPDSHIFNSYLHAVIIAAILIVCGMYGFTRGIHERIIPLTIGQPLRAIGYVNSVHTSHSKLFTDIVLTRIDTFHQTTDCSISVTSTFHIREVQKLLVGQYVALQGILVEENEDQNKQETPLLRWLHPSFHFVGKIKHIYARQSGENWVSLIRGKIHQAALTQSGNDKTGITTECLLESVLFGGNDVQKELHTVFLQAGVLHVLAASGANMVFMERMVSPVILGLTRFFPFGSFISGLWMIAFVWIYSMMCGGQPSIVRAAWMSSYRHLGHLTGRNPTTIPSLIFSAFCTALIHPAELWTISSLLSYMATYALDRSASSLFSRKQISGGVLKPLSLLSGGIRYARKIFVTSILVELYTAPLCEELFGQWTPYAVISNLFIEPILSILLPMSAVWFLISVLCLKVPILAFVCSFWTYLLFDISHIFEFVLTQISHFPFALVHLPPFRPMWLLPYYLCLSILPLLCKTIWSRHVRNRNQVPGLSVKTL